MDSLERSLKLVSNYGITLVIAVLAIALVVVLCWLAIKHVPRVVDASIDSQKRVATAVESMSDTIGLATSHLGEVRIGQRNLMQASDKAIEAFTAASAIARSKHDIPSDVFEKLEEARKILRQQGT